MPLQVRPKVLSMENTKIYPLINSTFQFMPAIDDFAFKINKII
ncbi:hypothetical protein [Moraxella lacunata]